MENVTKKQIKNDEEWKRERERFVHMTYTNSLLFFFFFFCSVFSVIIEWAKKRACYEPNDCANAGFVFAFFLLH